MTDPRILRIEFCGYLEFYESLCERFCEYGRCEIFSWEDYYDFGEIGEGVVCEECLTEWAVGYLVRRV